MASSKVSRHAQWQIRSLVREVGGKDFARLDVHADAVDDRPVDVIAHHRVELADARLGQIDLQRMFVE